MGYTIPEACTNSSFETGPRGFWLKYWSSIMSFPYGATCHRRSTFEQLSVIRSWGVVPERLVYV